MVGGGLVCPAAHAMKGAERMKRFTVRQYPDQYRARRSGAVSDFQRRLKRRGGQYKDDHPRRPGRWSERLREVGFKVVRHRKGDIEDVDAT